jgi:hypothetical protein
VRVRVPPPASRFPRDRGRFAAPPAFECQERENAISSSLGCSSNFVPPDRTAYLGRAHEIELPVALTTNQRRFGTGGKAARTGGLVEGGSAQYGRFQVA